MRKSVKTITPINGISKLTKSFFAGKTQKIISYLLILSALVIISSIVMTPEGQAASKPQAPRAVTKEQPKMGGTLIFGLEKEPTNPNAFIGTSSITQFVKETAYESLLTRDEEDKIIPNLAESYEVSAGGTAVTLRLRKGVKFHNGKEMRAEDVIWAVNHVKDPKNGAFGQSLIRDVRAVDKLDDYAVKFTLDRPSVTFLSHLCNIRMLPIVPANSLKPGQIKLPANVFVPGTGPFIFEKYQTGFDIVVKKFNDYWGAPAYLDQIVFKPISDNSSRFNALRTGDVLMADRLAPLDARRIKKGEINGVTVIEEPLGGFRHLIVNHDNPLLRKLEMRQALSYAIDKQRLVDEVFFGAATPTDNIMEPKSVWAKAANLPPHKYDPAKAKALLKAAGYNGQELSYIGRKQEPQFMESFARMLGEVGIKVKIELLEGGLMTERRDAGKYDLYVDGASITPEPVITMTPEYYTSKVMKGHYSNPKVDQLLDNMDREFDLKKRLQIFKELAWTLYNDADVPLFFDIRFLGLSEKVRGYGPSKDQNYNASGNYFKRAWLN